VRHSHRTFSNAGASTSEPEVARPLMTPDEVRRMRTDEVLIFTRGEMAGAGASGQFGGLGQQMAAQGMNHPPTIEIRPGYQFDVMVTEDLVFPGPFKQ
jgi:type IV secretory pathway VirB10-like protein